ncbi:hypothetical protein GQ457_16G010410 [Hibiscus cannabinus]
MAQVDKSCYACCGHTQSTRGTSAAGSDEWVVDSGATHHVTHDASKVTQAADYHGPGKLLIGNGSGLAIQRTCQSFLLTNSRMLRINNLFLVPSITKNLLFVSKFAKDNQVYFEFHARSCYVRDEVDGRLLYQGREKDGLYHFDPGPDSSNQRRCDVASGSIPEGSLVQAHLTTSMTPVLSNSEPAPAFSNSDGNGSGDMGGQAQGQMNDVCPSESQGLVPTVEEMSHNDDLPSEPVEEPEEALGDESLHEAVVDENFCKRLGVFTVEEVQKGQSRENVEHDLEVSSDGYGLTDFLVVGEFVPAKTIQNGAGQISHDSSVGGSKVDHYDGNQLQSQGARGRRGGYHIVVSPGNTQRVDTSVQVFTHTLSPMSASPQQMLHSGFNVSVPTQGSLISHPGSVHQMTPMHSSQGGSSHASSYVAPSPTTPATYVTTSSQWPVTNDGAWYLDTGATHHVTNDSANLQAGTVYTGNRRSLVLQNLLHVPLIKKNLLYVSQLVKDNDVVLEFNANGCVIKSSQSQNVLLRGELTPERLYQLSSPTHNSGSSSSSLHSDRGDFSSNQLNSKSFSSHVLPTKEHEASVKESGLPLVVSSPLIVSSQQRNFNVSQQPMVTDLGDGDSGCHPVSHMQDQTMQNIDIQENADIGVHRDSVQISHAHSGNNIHEDIFPQGAQVTDEIVAEELQGDSAILDGFQAGNAIEPVGEIESDGDGDFVPSLFGGNRHAMTTRSKNGIRKPKIYHVQASAEPTNI